ncbi:MAG: radical SAM/SPASM domain-containing protein [Planctomycetota bacterium JB042]
MRRLARAWRRLRNELNKRLVQFQNGVLRNERVFGHPFHLTLEPGNVCNLRCPLCPTPTRESRLPSGLLSLEDARRILDRFPYAVQLVLSNWGEPLLNPALFDIVREAKARDLSVRMESNLTRVRDGQLEALVDSGLDRLVVALDGASQETYERYRVGGVLETVLANVRRLRAVQVERDDFRTTVVWKMVVHRWNEHELDRARDLADELGMEFEAVTIWTPDDRREWLPSDRRHAGRRTEDGGPTRCHHLWQSVSVNFNGDVFPCCSEFAPSDRLVNVLDEPLAPVWNSEELRRRRRANRGPVNCDRCHGDKETRWYQTWMTPAPPPPASTSEAPREGERIAEGGTDAEGKAQRR